jgi:hypothetical protein
MKPSPMTPRNRTVNSVKHSAVVALTRIYLEAGLPFPAACKAALADHADFEKNRKLKDRPLCAA